MERTSDNLPNATQKPHNKLWISLSFLVFISLYFKYCLSQYTDVFLEAQFLHINFIKDLVNGVFHSKDFFTFYGEHLFPGYNILLFLNYKFFQIRASFDLFINYLSLLGTAAIFFSVAIKEKFNPLLTSILFLIILSPVQNPLWSMALAAQLSTFLLVAIVYLIYFVENRFKIPLLSVLIPIYILFFAGAYAFCFIGTLVSICIFANIRQEKKLLAWMIVISLFSFLAYDLILKTVAQDFSHLASAYQYNIKEMIKFADLMSGSSLLGKAFFEKFNHIKIYYAAGVFIFFLLSVAILFNIKNLTKKSDKFFLALLAYATLTILMVAVARNINGAEGALGQWYQAHLKFIPLAAIYFLFRINVNSNAGIITRAYAIGLLLLLILAGYYYEYIKAPYAKEWKADKGNTAIAHLLYPKQFLTSSSDPLLWSPQMVVDGIQFFYQNNLAYFRLNKFPYASPLTDDHWVEKNKTNPYFTILCPSHAKSVTMTFDSINSDNLKLIPHSKLSTDHDFYITNLPFKNNIKFFKFNLSQFSFYRHKNKVDERNLLFHVREITCN